MTNYDEYKEQYEHFCEGRFDSGMCGPAIDYCYSYDEFMWAGNGEYESQVKYCPYCGCKADKEPECTTSDPDGFTTTTWRVGIGINFIKLPGE